jgi:solute:Na+ symporter, SSS family
MAPSPIYIALAAVYLAALLLVGLWSTRHAGDSNQYLNATSSLPMWVCATACIAANCGSLDLFAMMALGAQYGMLACHFYWIGAIPALLFVAFVLLPAYRRGRNPTILDFIASHYGEATRSMVALCMAAMMLLIAGVSLCAAAQIVTSFLGWTFLEGVLAAASLVLFYTWAGGFRATIYTELFHFALVLLAVVPLLFLVARELGGFHRMMTLIPADRFHAWHGLSFFAPHAVMDGFGLLFGLGLVLAFGYWGTDFVQLQRALAVRREEDAPFVPLSIGFAKLAFVFLVALTGVAAPLVLSEAQLSRNWNATLPELMFHYYSSVWLVLGMMGLAASLISTFSNNIAGFTSAWVQGIYQRKINPDASDRHYTRVSRLTNAGVVILSVGAAYFALGFQSLMEYIQLVLSTFNAPLFALVALAVLAPRKVGAGGRASFLLGLGCSVIHQVLALTHVLHYGSQMAANFYGAFLGFSVTLLSAVALGFLRRPASGEVRTKAASAQPPVAIPWTAVAAGIVLAGLFVAFNLVFW